MVSFISTGRKIQQLRKQNKDEKARLIQKLTAAKKAATPGAARAIFKGQGPGLKLLIPAAIMYHNMVCWPLMRKR